MKTESNSSPTPIGPQGELRASERVLQYLLSEFESPDLQDGARLPSNKELAKRLNVSTPTVHAVIQQLAREGRVRTRRGSGTYLVAARKETDKPLRIMIATALDKIENPVNTWDSLIGAGMFHATLAAGSAISLEGFPRELLKGKEDIAEMLIRRQDEYAGMIVLPFSLRPDHRYIADLYEKAGKPVVYLYPPTVEATANFVSIDLFSSHYRVTRALIEAGRRRFVYFHVKMANPVRLSHHSSVGLQLRLSGISCALSLQGISGPTVVSSNGFTDEDAYQATRAYLKTVDEAPDAIVSYSETFARGIGLALEEAGLNVPQDVSLISNSGLDLTGSRYPDMTHIRPDLRLLGASLIRMLLERIRLGGRPLPGHVLPSLFHYGNTTTAAENELLRACLPPENA